jgi:hypothetical protein
MSTVSSQPLLNTLHNFKVHKVVGKKPQLTSQCTAAASTCIKQHSTQAAASTQWRVTYASVHSRVRAAAAVIIYAVQHVPHMLSTVADRC